MHMWTNIHELYYYTLPPFPSHNNNNFPSFPVLLITELTVILRLSSSLQQLHSLSSTQILMNKRSVTAFTCITKHYYVQYCSSFVSEVSSQVLDPSSKGRSVKPRAQMHTSLDVKHTQMSRHCLLLP